MQTLSTISDLRQHLARYRHDRETVALVPTMGNLHQGHLALVTAAQAQARRCIVSLFVNPMQFGAGEDLDRYPRTMAADSAKLQAAGCDILFAPTPAEVYPDGQDNQTQVSVPGLSEAHCGSSRPGHFTGVATVVCKLLQMVQPDTALFGEKDFQQLAVIRKMVRDLNIPVTIRQVATVRDPDGLALSSRNGYLSKDQRRIAPVLYQSLQAAAEAIRQGTSSLAAIEAQALTTLQKSGFLPDYFHVVDSMTLQPATPESEQITILAAAFLGKTRLIDNISIHR